MVRTLTETEILEKLYYGSPNKKGRRADNDIALVGQSAHALYNAAIMHYDRPIPFQNVVNWLQKQPIAQRTKRRRRKTKGTHHYYYVVKPDAVHEADLLYMDPSKGRRKGTKRYILGVIDCMSRVLATAPMRKRDADETLRAFKIIYEGDKSPLKGHFPKMIQSDLGSEFINKKARDFFAQHNINLQLRRSQAHARCIERVFDTLERKLFHLRDIKGAPRDWEQLLASAVFTYNNTKHTSLSGESTKATGGRTPMQVFEAGKLDDDAPTINHELPKAARHKPLYKLGDAVRIAIVRDKFRAADFRWSEGIHRITDVRRYDAAIGRPNSYHVDWDNSYWLHENDLQKVPGTTEDKMFVQAEEEDEEDDDDEVAEEATKATKANKATKATKAKPKPKPKPKPKAKTASTSKKRNHEMISDANAAKAQKRREDDYSRSHLHATKPKSTAELRHPQTINKRRQWLNR